MWATGNVLDIVLARITLKSSWNIVKSSLLLRLNGTDGGSEYQKAGRSPQNSGRSSPSRARHAFAASTTTAFGTA
jgi:hypothetical protein